MCARRTTRSTGWQRALRMLLITLLLPLFTALVAGTVVWVRGGKTFRLREWTVDGARLADRGRIERELGAVRGRPLAMLNLEELRERLADDSWISGLRVAKDWPDALSVTLREDEPLAWVIRDGRVRCLAASGRLLAPPRTGVSLDLPVLADAQGDWGTAARRLAELKRDFPGLYGRVERVSWGPAPELLLRGASPRVLLQAAQWRHGLSLLQIVSISRPELLARGGELDLRFVNQVVWRSGNA
jgi:cell division septal protein FtsQ